MSRLYIQPSWIGACENHPEWSGEHPDYRKCSSQELKVNSKAPKKPKIKRSAFESIALADSLYNRLEKQLEALENEFNDGLLSWDDFQYAHRLQTERMAKAWKRVEKARNWDKQEESLTEHPEQAINIKRNTDYQGILDSISDDNCFKQAYMLFRSIRVKLSKILLIMYEDSRGEEK